MEERGAMSRGPQSQLAGGATLRGEERRRERGKELGGDLFWRKSKTGVGREGLRGRRRKGKEDVLSRSGEGGGSDGVGRRHRGHCVGDEG